MAQDRVARILVVQTSGIGDCLLTTPAIRALHAAYPDAAIDTLSRTASVEVFQAQADVSSAHVLERSTASTWEAVKLARRQHYDLLVDFHASPRTAWIALLGNIPRRLSLSPARVGWRARFYNLHGVEGEGYSACGKMDMLKPLGVPAVDPTPSFPVDPEAAAQACEFFRARGIEDDTPVVALSPASRFDGKIWPRARWITLGERLAGEYRLAVVAVAPPGDLQGVGSMEEDSRGAIRVGEARGLPYLAAVFGRSSLVVSDCSGPRHVAVSQGVPTVTLHGSTSEVPWTHPSPRHVTVAADIECRPCLKNHCPLKTTECLERVTVEEVMAAAQPVLEPLRRAHAPAGQAEVS